jgi:hypothetical protein
MARLEFDDFGSISFGDRISGHDSKAGRQCNEYGEYVNGGDKMCQMAV